MSLYSVLYYSVPFLVSYITAIMLFEWKWKAYLVSLSSRHIALVEMKILWENFNYGNGKVWNFIARVCVVVLLFHFLALIFSLRTKIYSVSKVFVLFLRDEMLYRQQKLGYYWNLNEKVCANKEMKRWPSIKFSFKLIFKWNLVLYVSWFERTRVIFMSYFEFTAFKVWKLSKPDVYSKTRDS